MVAKRPASTKPQEWNSVKYVRGKRAVPGSGLRKDQTRWKRILVEILRCSGFQVVKLLIKDKILPNWKGRGKLCPKCNEGSPLWRHCGQVQVLKEGLPAKDPSPLLASCFSSLPRARDSMTSNPSRHTFAPSPSSGPEFHSPHPGRQPQGSRRDAKTFGVRPQKVCGEAREEHCVWQEFDVG